MILHPLTECLEKRSDVKKIKTNNKRELECGEGGGRESKGGGKPEFGYLVRGSY
jgi:hypothetical protein